MTDFHALIRAVPDFPLPGITFRDVTPLLADAATFAACIEQLAQPWQEARIEMVCGIESRGFIFGAALAQYLGAGFVPLRKPNKLPPPLLAVEYQLEYGVDRLEARLGCLAPGARTLLVDDVLATGGTLAAGATLVDQLGAQLVGGSVLIELEALAGRARWPASVPLQALLSY